MTALLVLHLLAASPSDALAPPQPGEDWYGWQPMVVDGTAIAFWAGSAVLSTAVESTHPVRQAFPLMIVAGGGIYLLGGPALHWGRGRGTTALIDLGIRALAPVTGALIGFGLCFGCSYGAIGPGFVGLLIGMISAAVFDYASLSWDPGEPVPPERASLQWAPFAGTACGEPVVGLAGTF